MNTHFDRNHPTRIIYSPCGIPYLTTSHGTHEAYDRHVMSCKQCRFFLPEDIEPDSRCAR